MAVLVAAGWKDDQGSSLLESWIEQLTPEFLVFGAAVEALRRYGGVEVYQNGPGQEVARENFHFIPTYAIGEGARFQSHAASIGTPLFPLGEAGGGHVFLAIAPDGRVFALMEDLWFVGETIELAIEGLILGRHFSRL